MSLHRQSPEDRTWRENRNVSKAFLRLSGGWPLRLPAWPGGTNFDRKAGTVRDLLPGVSNWMNEA